jgi:hypothetical protein
MGTLRAFKNRGVRKGTLRNLHKEKLHNDSTLHEILFG